MIEDSIGPPDTLDRAYRFVADKTVLFGFPDMLFGPDDVFARLLAQLRETDSHIALALYNAHDAEAIDTIDMDGDGREKSMMLKGSATSFRHGWVCAAWTPAFTRFLHEFVEAERRKPQAGLADLPVGAAIKAAIEEGLRACGVVFEHDRYLDIGTPDSLIEAISLAGQIGEAC